LLSAKQPTACSKRFACLPFSHTKSSPAGSFFFQSTALQ
jgi:hypothetical protein